MGDSSSSLLAIGPLREVTTKPITFTPWKRGDDGGAPDPFLLNVRAAASGDGATHSKVPKARNWLRALPPLCALSGI
jgi:hypothetical protein